MATDVNRHFSELPATALATDQHCQADDLRYALVAAAAPNRYADVAVQPWNRSSWYWTTAGSSSAAPAATSSGSR